MKAKWFSLTLVIAMLVIAVVPMVGTAPGSAGLVLMDLEWKGRIQITLASRRAKPKRRYKQKVLKQK